MSAHKLHTPGPYIVRGEIDAGLPGYAMGADPAPEDGTAPRNCGWPYFIREDREFPAGSGPLWLAHGIQRKADADLFAAAPDMLAALETALDAWRDQFDPPEGAAQSDLRINMADFMDWFTGWRESAVAAVAAAKGAA